MPLPLITPLRDLLLLDVTPKDQTTPAGIHLPVAVQSADTRMEATILTRGPECAREDLQPGQRVYVGKYLSGDITRGDARYKLACENDILAILA
jgi:co-chaperonin GroES (HSP10)